MKTRSRWGTRTPDNPWSLTNEISLTLRFHIRHDRKSKCLLLPLRSHVHVVTWASQTLVESAQVVIRWVRTSATPLPSKTHVTVHRWGSPWEPGSPYKLPGWGGAGAVKITVFISVSSWQQFGWETFIFDLLKGWNVCEKNVSDPPIMMSEQKAWDGFQSLGGKNAKNNE